ncbi:MAG: hypothetical protein JWP55_4782 [Mycobacterium sp.]|nr:hypothetical protein [Mycobacterium sp.]
MPDGSSARTEPVSRRPHSRPRRRTRDVDVLCLRSDGVRAAAQHTLQGAHWSGRALSRSSSSSSTAAVDGWPPASLAALRITTSSRSSASITSRVRIPLSRCAQGKGSAASHCRLTGGHPTVVDGPMLVVPADVSDQIAATAGGSNRDSWVIVPNGRTSRFTCRSAKLGSTAPGSDMTDAMSSPPKIESGKTLDLRMRRGAFPYLWADRPGQAGMDDLQRVGVDRLPRMGRDVRVPASLERTELQHPCFDVPVRPVVVVRRMSVYVRCGISPQVVCVSLTAGWFLGVVATLL